MPVFHRTIRYFSRNALLYRSVAALVIFSFVLGYGIANSPGYIQEPPEPLVLAVTSRAEPTVTPVQPTGTPQSTVVITPEATSTVVALPQATPIPSATQVQQTAPVTRTGTVTVSLGTGLATLVRLPAMKVAWMKLVVGMMEAPDALRVISINASLTGMPASAPITSTKVLTITPASIPPVGQISMSNTVPALVAVQVAGNQLGKPYIWGAAGPDAFDCSGLVQTAYAFAGINLPRTADQQLDAGEVVTSLLPGDLVFALDPSDPNYYTGERASHVGMWDGSAIINAAAPGVGVIREPFTDWWRAHFVGARRIPGALNGPLPASIVALAAPTPNKITPPTATATTAAVVSPTATAPVSATTVVTPTIPSATPPPTATPKPSPTNGGVRTLGEPTVTVAPAPAHPTTTAVTPTPSITPAHPVTKTVAPSPSMTTTHPVTTTVTPSPSMTTTHPFSLTVDGQFKARQITGTTGVTIVIQSAIGWTNVALKSSVITDAITLEHVAPVSAGYEWQFRVVPSKDATPRTYTFWSEGVLQYTYKP